MKIRMNFVSNSSSTSFIVCISPDDDMKRWTKDVRTTMEGMIKKDPEIEFDVTKDHIMNRLKALQKGEHLYEEGETMEWSIYAELFGAYGNKGIRNDRLVVEDVETNPLEGTVVNICAKGTRKKLIAFVNSNYLIHGLENVLTNPSHSSKSSIFVLPSFRCFWCCFFEYLSISRTPSSPTHSSISSWVKSSSSDAKTVFNPESLSTSFVYLHLNFLTGQTIAFS